MKSTLKEGFALPFAVALIAIFTILFGSIVTTASFYKNQKLIAIRKIHLNEISLIGLYDLYSAYNAYIQKTPQSSLSYFLENQIGFSSVIVNDIPQNFCNFSQDHQGITLKKQSESNPTESLIFYYDSSNQIIESCAISNQPKVTLIAKYSITFNLNNFGSIDIKGFRAESEP